MRGRTWAIAALLSGSGFCALVYQIAWLREFRLIFGASTAASAAVVAIFIAGLGAGGWLLGARADRHPQPLLFYAQLEFIVAASSAASPFLLALARSVYLASGGTTTLGLAGSTVVRLLLSALVLAVPTLAMGGTLPAAARAATRDGDDRRQDLAALYALNTLGAVAGCLVATFVLLEIFGTRSTLWLAALLNALVAMTARAGSRGADGADGSRAARGWDGARGADGARGSRGVDTKRAFVLIASATVGFAFFLMELVWYRLLAPLLGGSVFTFGLVLAVALAGIGIGGLVYAVTSRGREATLGGFAAVCLIEAAAVAGTFALGDRVAILTLLLAPLRASGFAASVLGWTAVTALVVMPPAIVSGYQFPMLIAHLGRGRHNLGREVGLAYAANTVGAIAGSLAGGFGLLPWLTAPGAWRLVAVVLLALGAAAALLAEPAERRAWLPLQIGAALIAVAGIVSAGPTSVWRHSGIGAGRVPEDAMTSVNQLKTWRSSVRQWVYWDGDGVESSVALATDASGFAFLVNGKSDGAARGDAGTQVMLGLIGALAHPRPQTALVVGLGTGSSAGWLAAIPGMERVDVVELEPLVVDVARECAAVNHDALANPRLRVVIGDARETLLTTRERYDVIASEPSNPFRAGIASLFTHEFYRAANARLTDQGVFAQWVQGYEIDSPTLRSIYATMAAVFPQVEAWQTHRGDLVLVAAKQPRRHSARELASRIAQEPYRSALLHAWRASGINGLLAHFVASDAVARELAGGPVDRINTDDRNTVEFGFARSVGVPRAMIVPELRRVSRAVGGARPPMIDEEGVSWPAVETARIADNAINGVFDDIGGDAPPEERDRQQALLRFYQYGDAAGARTLWQKQPSADPRDPIELRLVAGVEAEAGSDLALPWIERLRASEPAEADALLALLRFRQGRHDESAAALASSLVAFRRDPWPTQRSMERALELVAAVSERAPAAAPAVLASLHEPFVVRALDTKRLVEAADLARKINAAAACAESAGALEPHPPWTEYFLTLRRDCYRLAGDARLAKANDELAEFLRAEPVPLAR
jgi:spermidine synthase